MELVSIITPTYNSEKFISETLMSIINQTYSNWELLITDDNSSDSTVNIINDFIVKDKRIKLFQLNKNSGAGVARNNSIYYAQGKYISFCDSDDQWKENKLELQIEFMKRNNLSFSYSAYDLVNESGLFKKTIYPPSHISFKKMLNNNYVGCLTAIYDSEKLGKKYMPKIRKRQDWVLWLSILDEIKETKGLNKSLAIYRDRSGSISKNKLQMLYYNWKVYYHVLDYGLIKSIFLIFNFIFFYVIKKFK